MFIYFWNHSRTPHSIQHTAYNRYMNIIYGNIKHRTEKAAPSCDITIIENYISIYLFIIFYKWICNQERATKIHLQWMFCCWWIHESTKISSVPKIIEFANDIDILIQTQCLKKLARFSDREFEFDLMWNSHVNGR